MFSPRRRISVFQPVGKSEIAVGVARDAISGVEPQVPALPPSSRPLRNSRWRRRRADRRAAPVRRSSPSGTGLSSASTTRASNHRDPAHRVPMRCSSRLRPMTKLVSVEAVGFEQRDARALEKYLVQAAWHAGPQRDAYLVIPRSCGEGSRARRIGTMAPRRWSPSRRDERPKAEAEARSAAPAQGGAGEQRLAKVLSALMWNRGVENRTSPSCTPSAAADVAPTRSIVREGSRHPSKGRWCRRCKSRRWNRPVHSAPRSMPRQNCGKARQRRPWTASASTSPMCPYRLKRHP